MRAIKLTAVLGTAVLLGACTGSLNQINSASPSGDTTGFQRALGDKYRDLANYEANRMNDWADAEHYANKALAAFAGEDVQPDEPNSRALPANLLKDAEQDRKILLGLLEKGNWRSRRPSLSAEAQTKYDCWLEQLEEGWQTDEIAACRADFLDAIGKLLAERSSAPAPAAAAPAPAPAPAPEPKMAPAQYTVYFQFDSVELTEGGADVIKAAAEEAAKRDVKGKARATKSAQMTAIGHTDRSGSDDYNETLSIRRAATVRALLMEAGVPAGVITIDAVGEGQPAVITNDGVKEPWNRRVVITIQ